MAAKFILPLLVGVGAGAVLLKKKKSSSKKSGGGGKSYLSGYFSPGATIGAAEGLSGIEKSVTLNNIVMRDDNGDMHPVARATFHANGSWIPGSGVVIQWPISGNGLERVVTNFYGPGARAFAEEIMDGFISGNYPADSQDPAVAAQIAKGTLKRLRPKIDWDGVTPDSAEGMVLDGARIIARIIQQNMPGA